MELQLSWKKEHDGVLHGTPPTLEAAPTPEPRSLTGDPFFGPFILEPFSIQSLNPYWNPRP